MSDEGGEDVGGAATGESEEEEPINYHHDFTEHEMEQLMYQGDEFVHPVREYNYMKEEWKKIAAGEQQVENKKDETSSLRKNAKNTGHRTEVDLNKDAPEDEEPKPLLLDTGAAIHIVEFYAPWCPHCRVFKEHYVELAREVKRRSILLPVEFYAVSCELYREVCRSYSISGFPVVLGWGLGTDIEERGIELNPPGYTPDADAIGQALGLNLASEAGGGHHKNSQRNFTSPEEKQEFQLGQIQDAIKDKVERLGYEDTINDRYHNAAASFAFILTSSVFLQPMTDKRALSLMEFVELVDWATPASWQVRTGLVQDLLNSFGDIIIREGGQSVLSTIVRKYRLQHVEDGMFGDIEVRKSVKGHKRGLGVDVPHSAHNPEKDQEDVYWKNVRFTEACTHGVHGMGFTCGLWDLLHIVSIGATFPHHRLYGYRNGYQSVTPSMTAETIKRFIQNFFSCDVCKWHFLDMYNNCGHGRCERLKDELPELMSGGADSDKQVGTSRQIALWLWEVHNDVNVRLMRESAERQDRNVTQEERLSALFPTIAQCPNCWRNDDRTLYDEDAVFDFLHSFYWPRQEHVYEKTFRTVMRRKLGEGNGVHGFVENWLIYVAPMALFAGYIIRKVLENRADHNRKKL